MENIKNLYNFKELDYNKVHTIPYVNFVWDGNKVVSGLEMSDNISYEYHSPKLYKLAEGESIIDFIEKNKKHNIVLPQDQPDKRFVYAWVDKDGE